MSEARAKYKRYLKNMGYSGNMPNEAVMNYVCELEQRNRELIEFVKKMRALGMLNPERLPEYTDVIYHDANDLLSKIEENIK